MAGAAPKREFYVKKRNGHHPSLSALATQIF
jgi:hypothetical protein